ncbi:MAG: MoxR family ATPase [Thermonemataceae bacterium]|nr:MoxR family ATPase [Thermonemataceae bacterium]
MEQQDNIFSNRVNLDELKNKIELIRQEIAKVIVGQENVIDLMLTAILADGHILLEGVPGVAKTLTAKLFAKIMSIKFSRIQFTPDLMPSDVIGTSIFNLKNSEFEFRQGPVFANLVLIDEINRAPAKTQAALFEVMEERQITFDGKTYLLPPPFLVMATQNPIEQEGTYKLPEAQLDRFLFKIEVNYPTLEQETDILDKANSRKSATQLSDIQSLLSGEDILRYRAIIKEIHVERHLLNYIAQITDRTRNNHALYLGASPRASLAMLNASKAYAALDGRDFITPEDIKFLAFPILRHRIMLSPEKEIEGVSVEDVINQIVQSVEVPR